MQAFTYRTARSGSLWFGLSIAIVVETAIGRRFVIRLTRGEVAAAVLPSWRELPEPGTPAAVAYLNLTEPASPNVLIRC